MRRRVFLHGLGAAGAGAALELPARAISGVRAGAAGGGHGRSVLAWLAEAGAVGGVRVTRFEGSHIVGRAEAGLVFAASTAAGRPGANGNAASSKLVLDGTTIGCRVLATPARDRADAGDLEVVFRVMRGRLPSASVAVTLTLGQWSREAYLMIPGAVYGGNRFASRHIPFPPLVAEPSDIGPHVPPIISDIPRLNNEAGESGIALTAADTAVPAICVRLAGPAVSTGGPASGNDAGGRGFVILAEPTTPLGLTGLEITESSDRRSATLSIATPAVRPDFRYGLCNGRAPSEDRGADLDTGFSMTLRLRVLSFSCPDVQTLFDRWYEARRDRIGARRPRHVVPLSVARRLIEGRLLAEQWNEVPAVFVTRSPLAPTVSGAGAGTGAGPATAMPAATTMPAAATVRRDGESIFQTGADGALALVLPELLMSGATEARNRAGAVLDFQLNGQAPSGLFHAASDGVTWWDEGELPPPTRGEVAAASSSSTSGGPGIVSKSGTTRAAPARSIRGRHWSHIGRNAEALHLACKQVLLLQRMDPAFRLSTRVRKSLARAADAMVRLWGRYQQLGQYINVETGDLIIGGSTAGALVPAALVLAARVLETDSYVRCAGAVAEAFFEKFVRLGLTLGGAPAALQCPDSRSASGLLESFVTLAEATGDGIWFSRATEVAHQLATWVVAWDVPLPPESTLGKMGARTTGAVLVSAQDKWGLPGFAGLSGDAWFRLYRATGRVSYLELLRETIHNSTQYVDADVSRPDSAPSTTGWVAGRIPLGDALGMPGDVPAATPAGTAQASCLMAAVEIPSIYLQPDTSFLFAFDHIEARITTAKIPGSTAISVTNPTRFEATLRIYSEMSDDRTQPLELFPLWGARSLILAAGATEELDFPAGARAAGI